MYLRLIELAVTEAICAWVVQLTLIPVVFLVALDALVAAAALLQGSLRLIKIIVSYVLLALLLDIVEDGGLQSVAALVHHLHASLV